MSSTGTQFTLLLWKNFVLQKRKKCVTVFEILVPVFFAALLLIIRLVSDSTYIDNNTEYSSFPLSAGEIPAGKQKLLYTPSNLYTDALMSTVQNATNSTSVISYSTEAALVDAYSQDTNNDIWAGVVFSGDFTSGWPTTINYKLRVALRIGNEDRDRWRTDRTFQFFTKFGYRNNQTTGGQPWYYDTGFLTLQYQVDKALIETLNSSADLSNNYDVRMQKMPYPPFLNDVLTTVLSQNLPLFLILSFILNALQISKGIAYEKEKKLKEAMKMMGLSTTMYWVSWFVKCLLYQLLVIVIITVLFHIPLGDKGKLLNYSQPTVFFFFLLFYIIATIAFCFMISTFFNKANSAAFAAGILYFLSFFPVFFLNGDRYEGMSQGEKMAAGLLSNVAMAFGINTIIIYEGTGEGAQWNNFFRPGTVDDNFSLLDSLIMLWVDTVLYMVIAWYVDSINPGDAGVAQPPWFIFMPSYWCGSKRKYDYENNGDGTVQSDYFERDPTGAQVGISIRHLKKSFGQKVAVRDTTLNLFEGQITALLGHNGAGKTTTISMLTGFLEPSGGNAIVNGYDIRTDIASVRKTLGLCPQHNILFDLLTVEEHLEFFAKLKGCPRKDVKKEVNDMIGVLGLEQKRFALSATLSGGQKRKLSVGIALIAGSQTVILDEPTSGMDPAARRQTWEILQKYRQGRTIILTTHFMDEADILGDRIAIMTDGVVKCCGTSLFLKKLYGAGYHMVIVKSKTCNVDHLTKMIQSYIPTANKESEISAEVSYLLPFSESAKFEKLFTDVEKNFPQLGITSFGVSATTMEEVFLKVGEGAEDEEETSKDPAGPTYKKTQSFINPNYGSTNSMDKPKIAFAEETKETDKLKNGALDVQMNGIMNKGMDYTKTGATNGDSVVSMESIDQNQYISYNKNIHKNTGFALMCQQFHGMFIKKLIHSWRNKVVSVVQLVLPIIFTMMALAVEKSLPSVGDEPSLLLDYSRFSDFMVPYSEGTVANVDNTALANAYKNQFAQTEKVNRATFTTMDDYFLDKKKDIGDSTFNAKVIVAGDFESASPSPVTSHFNDQPYHGIAISLHYLMNGMLRYFTNDAYNINAYNHPFPKKLNDNSRAVFFSTSGTGFTIAISVLFGMAFMSTSFIIFLIKERSVGAKHLQVVSGVGPGAFWLSTFVWDIINYTIPVLCILVVFAAFQTEAYVNDGRLGIVFLIFMVYGWAVLPFVYLLHYLFKVPATGMVVVSMINLGTGLVFLLAVYILSIPQLGTEDIGKALEWIFMILLPNFDLGSALMDMYTNSGYKDTCESYKYETVCRFLPSNATFGCCFPDRCGSTCFTFYDNFLHWDKPGVGRQVTFMALQGLVYFGLVLLAEAGIFTRIWNGIHSQPSSVGSTPDVRLSRQSSVFGHTEDSDVAEEKGRINDTAVDTLQQTDSIILKNVHKYYGQGHFHAVKNVSIGIAKEECFGLLGQNGAGKTTTFKMLTGDEMLSSGSAYLNRYSVKSDIKKVQQNLGYCPQFDALIDQMTGEETLYMYARLRGIENSQIPNVVQNLIDTMMLRKHAVKQAGVYSGGNKRKLSTAISLIGDPPFVFLDEPTTGMDPAARRQLWNVLSQVRASGRTLVLTSHSMEECDALCTKIVIMVNGQFVCLGSPQHLKSKFGHGYTLFCRMALDENGTVASGDRLVEYITTTFPNSQVFESSEGYIDFQIPDDNAKLGQIFGVMERAKAQYQVEDYSVHQTTLEQIFLTFTQNQVAPKEKKKRTCCFCCRLE